MAVDSTSYFPETAADVASDIEDSPLVTVTPDGDLTNEFALSSLTDGILKHSSGTPARAVPGTDYVPSAGVSGGQTIQGGTGAGDDLTLSSTSHATKGNVHLGTASTYDEVNDRLGLGTTSPTARLDVLRADSTGTVALFRNLTSTVGAQLGVAGEACAGRFIAYGTAYAEGMGGSSDKADSTAIRSFNNSGGTAFVSAATDSTASMRFHVGGETNGTLRLTIDVNGNIVPGSSALATTATDGFVYLGSCTGTPTGVPAGSYTGRIPLIFDTTNNILYAYSGAGWVRAAGQHATTHQSGGNDAIKIDDLAAADDNSDLNATTSSHGLVVKATAPAANVLNVVGIANGETAYTNKSIFDGTNPAALGTAAPGTSLVAAHRDHVHELPKLDALATPDDSTTLDSSTSRHGLLKKLSNVSTEFMNGVGNWATPPSTTDITGMTGSTAPSVLADYIATYDASAAANRKVLFRDYVSGRNASVISEEFWKAAELDGGLTTETSGGSVALNTSPEAAHPGTITCTTGAGSGWAGIDQNGASQILLGAGKYRALHIIKTPSALSDGTNTYQLGIGFGDNLMFTGTDVVQFRYTHSVVSGNWALVTRSNTTETVTDSSSAVAAGTWYALEYEVNAAASSVEFFVNGTSVGTVSTNIPSGAGRYTEWNCGIASTAGAARSMDIDYMGLIFEPTSAR